MIEITANVARSQSKRRLKQARGEAVGREAEEPEEQPVFGQDEQPDVRVSKTERRGALSLLLS